MEVETDPVPFEPGNDGANDEVCGLEMPKCLSPLHGVEDNLKQTALDPTATWTQLPASVPANVPVPTVDVGECVLDAFVETSQTCVSAASLLALCDHQFLALKQSVCVLPKAALVPEVAAHSYL